MRKLIVGIIAFICTFVLGKLLTDSYSYAQAPRPAYQPNRGYCKGAAYYYGHFVSTERRLIYTTCEDFGNQEKAAEVMRSAVGAGKVLWSEPITSPGGHPRGSKLVVSFGDIYGVMWTDNGVYRRVDSLTLGSALDGETMMLENESGRSWPTA